MCLLVKNDHKCSLYFVHKEFFCKDQLVYSIAHAPRARRGKKGPTKEALGELYLSVDRVENLQHSKRS